MFNLHAPHHRTLLAMAVLLGTCFLAATASAQVQIGIELKKKVYIQHGPVEAIIKIRNLAGRDVFLDNEPDRPWLSFRLKHASGRMVPMLNPLLKFDPLLIESGQVVKRKIDINRIFSMEMLGEYTLYADLFLLGSDRYIASNREVFNLSRGREIWTRLLGVPESQSGGGERRLVQIFTHRNVDRVYLWLKISNPDGPQIYCMRKLGRYASYANKVAVETDINNAIHVLHLAAPRTYINTVVDLNGELIQSQIYDERNSRPQLASRNGQVKVLGGSVRKAGDPVAGRPPSEVPRISDRPVDFQQSGPPGG